MSLDLQIQTDFGGLEYQLDLSFPAPGITALFGPSGAGKSTILRVIAGLQQLPGATVKFDGQTWQDEELFLPPHQRQVGFVFQDPSLFTHLNVIGNLEFAMDRAAADAPAVEMQEVINLLGLSPLLYRDTTTLSGGEKQRVAIARALANSPRLLLMDEPLTGVDVGRVEEILPFIEGLRDHLDIPVLYVSHNTDEVARIAGSLVCIEQGKSLGFGRLSDMLTRLDLPLAQRPDAEAVLHAVAAGYDPDHHINTLAIKGGALKVLGREIPFDEPVRVRIPAQNVSIALTPQDQSSILNSLPAVIVEREDNEFAESLLKLRVGNQMLLSRITQYSADALKLSPGDTVFAQVKSVAVLKNQ